MGFVPKSMVRRMYASMLCWWLALILKWWRVAIRGAIQCVGNSGYVNLRTSVIMNVLWKHVVGRQGVNRWYWYVGQGYEREICWYVVAVWLRTDVEWVCWAAIGVRRRVLTHKMRQNSPVFECSDWFLLVVLLLVLILILNTCGMRTGGRTVLSTGWRVKWRGCWI